MSQAGVVNQNALPGVVDYLQGNTGGQVGPDGTHTILLIGAGTITVSGNPGTNTLTISDMDASWSSVSSSQAMSANKGYFAVSPGGALILSLPSTSVQGDVVQIALDGATSVQISQAAGQLIVYGNQQTTLGVSGSLTSTGQGDSIRLVCRTANLRWVIVSAMGNWVFV